MRVRRFAWIFAGLGCNGAAPAAEVAEVPVAPAPVAAAAPVAPAVKSTDESEEGLMRRVAIALRGRIGEGAEFVEEGRALKIGGHTLRVAVVIEQVVEQDGKQIAGLVFRCVVDGESAPPLFTSSVGVGESRREAIEATLSEWATQYGEPIAAALRGPASGAAAQRVGSLRVYAGPVGIRGEMSGARFDEAWRAEFLKHLEPIAAELFEGPGLHALALTLVIDGETNEGECRADGVGSLRLCALARAYAWPAAQEPYMFKQFFVLVDGG